MKTISLRDTKLELSSRITPSLPVIYALLLETIELALLAVAVLMTIEAILPGFISIRINLSEPIIAILLLTALSATIGKSIGATFPFAPNKKSPLAWVGISWLAFLLTLSTIKFPFWAVPIVVGAFFLLASLFWKLLFRKE